MRASIAAAFASLVLVHAAPARADTVHQALEAYALYQNDVSALLDLDVDSAKTINGALVRVSRHNPSQVSRGFIAYGALTAAQSPAFAAGIQSRMRGGVRSQLLNELRRDNAYARQTPGSSQAIQLILNSASADSARAAFAGARYDHIARASTARWIMSSDRGVGAVGGNTRLTQQMRERLGIGALGAQPMSNVDAFGGRRFWDSFSGRDAQVWRAGAGGEKRGYSDVTNRMLTVAALVVAGAAGGDRAHVSSLLDEPITKQCMVMQQLQLRQCLSVSVDASERTYCLGHHGLSGPGSCFSAMVR